MIKIEQHDEIVFTYRGRFAFKVELPAIKLVESLLDDSRQFYLWPTFRSLKDSINFTITEINRLIKYKYENT